MFTAVLFTAKQRGQEPRKRQESPCLVQNRKKRLPLAFEEPRPKQNPLYDHTSVGPVVGVVLEEVLGASCQEVNVEHRAQEEEA